MKEQIKESIKITEDQDVINSFQENNLESKKLLLQYVDRLHNEADVEANNNSDRSNIININTEVKIAELYYKIPDEEYKKYAIESLEQIFQNAGNDKLPTDLVEYIYNLIKIWKSNIK